MKDASSLGSRAGYPEGRPNPVRNTRTAKYCSCAQNLSMPIFGAVQRLFQVVPVPVPQARYVKARHGNAGVDVEGPASPAGTAPIQTPPSYRIAFLISGAWLQIPFRSFSHDDAPFGARCNPSPQARSSCSHLTRRIPLA